jgi:aminopeptidase N
MRQKIIVMVVILCLGLGGARAQDGGVTGADGIGDPDFPQLGNGGYDAQHYTIDLNADVKTDTIAGTVTMTAILTEDVRTFNLDFASDFDISAVTLNGAAVDWEHQPHELIIKPANPPLTAGDKITVGVTYSG